MLKLVLTITMIALSVSTSTPTFAGNNGSRQQCTVPGSVAVEIPNQGVRCILTVTDVEEMAKATDLRTNKRLKTDLDHDPNCDGRPDGWIYDIKVVGPDGAPGIAHVTCGVRP